jgi:hypothetical protein
VSTEEPMSVEDRVRTATRAGATLVRDIGPLAAPDPVRLRPRSAPAARRWRSWGIPLAAAAAVVLVALSLVAVRQFGASAPAVGGPASNLPATVPRYYVALSLKGTGPNGYEGSGDLTVGDDHTGTAIATITPPDGVGFYDVQGASDDRTFVVMATSGKHFWPTGPESWYLLRISPGTARPYQLTKLPIKIPGSYVDSVSYALSPDDRELAVESLGDGSGSAAVTTVALYSVSSGAELRAWTTGKFPSGPIERTISWLPDGRQLAFTATPPGADQGGSNQLRILDVTGSGSDLITASRVLLTLKSPSSSPSNCYSMSLTPDGGTVICGTKYGILQAGAGTAAGCANGGLEITAYSARTGKPVRVLYRYRGACRNGLTTVGWTDPSARYIVGDIDVYNKAGTQAVQLGVITDGHIRLLKLPKSVSPPYDRIVAF